MKSQLDPGEFAPQEMSTLRLHTFGGCFVARDGVRMEALSSLRKGLVLLAALAAAGDRGVSRETLLAYLWPESDQERARISLNQLVHSLRQQVRAPELLLTVAEYRLNGALITSDVREFRDAIRRNDDAAAAALYAGPFLDGFYIKGADELERWMAGERAALAQDFARVLESLAERASANGDVTLAVQHWRHLAGVSPLSARAATGLIRALDAAGERAAALQHARVYQLLVREEVDGAPDPTVAALVAELQHAKPAVAPVRPEMSAQPDVAREVAPHVLGVSPRPKWRSRFVAGAGALLLAVLAAFVMWRPRDSTPPNAAQKDIVARRAALATPSVAVLPFANTSGDPADEHFSDGLSDELISALGKVSGLKVSGRTSAFALKGRRLSVRAVADTLHVATVLEGSVRRANGRLKVTAQLVNAADDSVLWSDSYDREPKDVFAVQEQIAGAIVGALRVQLGAGGVPRVKRATADLVAYDMYLKGRYFLNRLTPDDMRRAFGYFEQAVARDPTYAQAYAGLADAHLLVAIFGNLPPGEELARAKSAAAHALSLDSTLAEAHTSLAGAEMAFDWNWRAAGHAFERAIALDPGYGLGHQRYGLYLLYQGQFAHAESVLVRARALDPLYASANMNLARVYVSTHRPTAAIPLLRTAVELSPGVALAHEQLGHALLETGNASAALAAFRQAALLSGPRDSAQLAYALAMTNQRPEAERILRALIASARDRYLPPVGVAMAYVGLGDHDAAFRWLDRGYEGHAAFMDGIKVSPPFDPLHSDPRWETLLRRLRLVP